jgi:PAS domain S-box-containing protein
VVRLVAALLAGRQADGARRVPDGRRIERRPAGPRGGSNRGASGRHPGALRSLSYPPLRDASGRLTGAINLLVDISKRNHSDLESAKLAAIVTSSDDAIISKTIEGRITSWNAAATRLLGYEPSEIIGRPITTIIPPELHDEEKEIIAQLRRGERIDHYETVRLAKNGSRIDLSLSVSPLRDKLGNVVGAAKVARDITERKRAEKLQQLLLEELNHRVKNTLSTIQAMATQSLRHAASPSAFVSAFSGRVQALARAHDLLTEGKAARRRCDAAR